MTLTVLRSTARVFCRISLNLELRFCFSRLDWSYGFWGEWPQVCMLSCRQGCSLMGSSWPSDWDSVFQVSPQWNSPSPHSTVWKQFTKNSPHHRVGIKRHLSSGSVYINYMGFFSRGGLSHLSHLFIQYFMDWWLFCLWIIIYFVSYFVQIVATFVVGNS